MHNEFVHVFFEQPWRKVVKESSDYHLVSLCFGAKIVEMETSSENGFRAIDGI